MIAIRNTRTPASLIDNLVEFFKHQEEARCISGGQVYSFEDFPEYVIDKLLHIDFIKGTDIDLPLNPLFLIHPVVRSYYF